MTSGYDFIKFVCSKVLNEVRKTSIPDYLRVSFCFNEWSYEFLELTIGAIEGRYLFIKLSRTFPEDLSDVKCT